MAVEESRHDGDAHCDADLLTHVVHANGGCHLFLWGTEVEAEELGGRDHAGKEAEWEAN